MKCKFLLSQFSFNHHTMTSDILHTIKVLFAKEGIAIQGNQIGFRDKVITDSFMNKEDENGILTQLNGDIGSVALPDGRIGKIILTIDFRETVDILTPKEYGS